MTATNIADNDFGDIVISRRLPAWWAPARTVFNDALLLASCYLVGSMLYDWVTRGLSAERFYTVSGLAAWSVVPGVLILVLSEIISSNRSLAIRDDGIALDAEKLPWDWITVCRWARYRPGKLAISTRAHGRFSFWVPESNRPSVEAAIRRRGKWDLWLPSSAVPARNDSAEIRTRISRPAPKSMVWQSIRRRETI
jgi:hypothetical protein